MRLVDDAHPPFGQQADDAVLPANQGADGRVVASDRHLAPDAAKHMQPLRKLPRAAPAMNPAAGPV